MKIVISLYYESYNSALSQCAISHQIPNFTEALEEQELLEALKSNDLLEDSMEKRDGAFEDVFLGNRG